MIPPKKPLFYLQCTRLVVALCLLLIALPWPVAIGGELVDARQETVSALEAGKTIERQLSGGEAHAFQITLPLGQRLRVIADQHGIDVVIKIFTLQESRVDTRQGVDAALLERERDLTRQLNAKATRQLQLGAKSPQLAALEQEISQLENEFEIVGAAIRKDSPHYDALVQPQPLALAELQQQLEDDTLLLEYKLGDERSWLWAITRRTLKTYELPKREQIELAAARFRQHLIARSLGGKDETPLQRRRRIAAADAKLSEAAAALSAMILDPAAGQLADKRLVIVPDGALHYVAFAALPAPKIERRRNKAMGRRGDGEARRRGDGETGRWGDEEKLAPSPCRPVAPSSSLL